MQLFSREDFLCLTYNALHDGRISLGWSAVPFTVDIPFKNLQTVKQVLDLYSVWIVPLQSVLTSRHRQQHTQIKETLVQTMKFFVSKVLTLFILLPLLCNTLAKKGTRRSHNERKDSSNELSTEEKNRIIQLMKNQGKPNWGKEAEKLGKERAEKMKASGVLQLPTPPGKDASNSTALHTESGASTALPTENIQKLTDRLSRFVGPLANRVKNSVSGLSSKWSNLEDDDRVGIAGTLGVITGSIDAFGNAGSNPVGAFKATIDIIGSISSNFGPKGQLLSMGLGFVSSLLGLFGKKGPTPKPMSEVVREQIDEALAEYRDAELTSEASGMIRAFRTQKAYLDGAAESGNPLNLDELQFATSTVIVSDGLPFMGKLYTIISKMFDENKEEDSAPHKCIQYCELYAKMQTLKDLILTQFISMASNVPNIENHVNGLIGMREDLRLGTKFLFQKLYTIDYFSKILPYFDPDTSPVTDAYSTVLLDLGKYDRSISGLYCIHYAPKNKDLTWEYSDKNFKVGSNPYTLAEKSPSNDNCYWKLVPHGNSIFSIRNKFKCNKDNKKKCEGAMLSYDGGNVIYVNIDVLDPVLWEIVGDNWRGIRNKWHCPSDANCGKDLRIVKRTEYKTMRLGANPFFRKLPYTKQVGALLSRDGKNYWKLRKRRT